MSHTPFELVIFDCDGVLVDSERLTVEIEARVLTAMGWPISPEEVARRFVGRASDEILWEIEQRLRPERTEEFDRISSEEIIEAFRSRLEPIAGARQLVESLMTSGVATCVASSGSHRKMELTLGVTELWPLFVGRVFSADDVGRGKPWPDLFVHAARSMRVEPASTAVIEDSVHGVRAAVAAGMTCFGYAGGLTSARVLAEAGATPFGAMVELAPLLITPHE